MRILLVEDNPADARLTEFAIHEAGLESHVDVVENGELAVVYLQEVRTRNKDLLPDIVLLDLNMPKMDGKATLRALKKSDDLRSIPVIILSTSDARSDIEESYALYANSYLTKPSDFGTYVQSMMALKHFWADAAKLPGLEAPAA